MLKISAINFKWSTHRSQLINHFILTLNLLTIFNVKGIAHRDNSIEVA